MKYLVTGGSGLIGRFLLPKLEEAGHEPFNFDLLEGYDVMDFTGTRDFLSAWRPDRVIHLAAQSLVEKSKEFPRHALEINVMGTVNLLEACRQVGVQDVLTASTNHVYGDAHPPHYETAPMRGRDIYTASKISADVITQAYARVYGMNTVAVRPTNTYGPNDPHDTHIVPGTILSVLRGDLPTIRSNGKQVKSYLYGEDCADAFRFISENLETLRGKAVNVVGSSPFSSPVSVIELVMKILTLMAAPDGFVVLDEPNELHDEYLDGGVLNELGWEPEHSLGQGLTKTIAWFANAERERDKAVT